MQSTLQHVYATNLKQKFGYPLRNPQPDIKLSEPYKSEGLQIGDIGHVNQYGKFDLLFNIKIALGDFSKWKFPPEGSDSADLAHFDRSPLTPALDPNRVFMMGVKQDSLGDSRSNKPYIFTAKRKEGAILILPDGASLLELEEKYLEHIRNHISKYAPEWCKYAKRGSLYLITAVYKAKSWTLGSFDRGTMDEKIQVHHGDNSAPAPFTWESAFEADSQQGPKGNIHLNQAVFIKGFKITVRDPKLLTLERLEPPEAWFTRILSELRLKARKLLPGSTTTIKYFPQANFSEPSHPLDIVNHVLLGERPGAQMAITHDNDWIEMLNNGLSLENLMDEGPLRDCIAKTYKGDLDLEHNTVCLRRISGDKTDGAIELLIGRGEKTGGECKPDECKPDEYNLDECKPDECPQVPGDNSRLVITHMRLESFDVGPIDAGVCVFVQFWTTTRRTSNKPHANIIEWDDEITLPSDGPVHVTVRGTFQLGSTLGTREISEKKTINPGDMPRSTYNLKFSFGDSEHRSSLLITLERHFSYCETNFNYEENSEFVQTTTRGFENFYSYNKEYEKEHLDAALECFRSAIEQCGPDPEDPERRAAAYFNLATSEFVQCRVNGIYSQFNTSIDLYRKALQLRGDNHQDRPATLLLLAQALLSCHGQDYDEFVVEEIAELLAELPPDDSRDRKTADAILATCRFYHAINAEHPADVDLLLTDFQRDTYTPSYGHFDRPHLLHKLGFAFWRRFRSSGTLDDLDMAILLNADALHVPDGHDDKKRIADCLGNSLLCGLQARGELTDVDTSVGLMELGKKVIAMLDGISHAEGASAPSEDLQEQIDLKSAVTQLREQIHLMSSVERVREQAAMDVAPRDITEQGPSSHTPEVDNPINDWSRDEVTVTECQRHLGVLLSFLGGEGDIKMRKALEETNPEWPYKDHKIVATMQGLETHMPYFYTILARRLRFVVEGWC